MNQKIIKTTISHLLIFALVWICASGSYAQSAILQQIEELIKQEGEIFIVVSRPTAGQNKPCREENALSNQISFHQDSAFVRYVNHTELFCETYVLQSQYSYQFSLKDVAASSLRLIEKKYDYSESTLEQGPDTWYELELVTINNKPCITKMDIISRQTEYISSVNLLFKSKQGAIQALQLLKKHLKLYTS